MRSIPGTNNISYHKKEKKYKVFKNNVYLGGYSTLIGALMIRDWCEANNWKPHPNRVCAKPGMEYIRHVKDLNVYEIIKTVNGCKKYFGRYDTLDEAIKYRDYFRDNDWDVNLRLINTRSKNIYFKHGIYYINKMINGKSYSFGSFDNYPDAERRLKEIRLKGWENVLKDNGGLVDSVVSNIRRLPNGKFHICKTIDGVTKYFGVYNTRDDAEAEVRLLRKSGWDYDILCDCIDETNDGDGEWLSGGVRLKSSFQKQDKRNDYFLFSRDCKNDIHGKLNRYGL